MRNPIRFREFVQNFTCLIERAGDDEARILNIGGELLAGLVRRDDWLPDEFGRSHHERYRQYLLYCDPLERFCVISLVWGPGQRSLAHDHSVWGIVGMLRGTEVCRKFDYMGEGKALQAGEEHRLNPGEIHKVSPRIGDIHEVANASPDHSAISIHVYGANMETVRRHDFDPVTGLKTAFVSSYHNGSTPGSWNHSPQPEPAISQVLSTAQ